MNLMKAISEGNFDAVVKLHSEGVTIAGSDVANASHLANETMNVERVKIANFLIMVSESSRNSNNSYQKRVNDWVMQCFPHAAKKIDERSHRFLEEALELAQTTECSREDAHALVD